jgi:hypothetical protein
MKELIGKYLVCDNGTLDEEKGLCVAYYYEIGIAYVILKLNEQRVTHYKASDIINVTLNPHNNH